MSTQTVTAEPAATPSANTSSQAAPVFVVGCPRSGTKLLMRLMNEHPRIKLLNECDCLPYWHQNWAKLGDLSQRDAFEAFYKDAVNIRFFLYMRLNQHVLSSDAWYDMCRGFTVADVYEALARYYTGIGWDDTVIWGDKSPPNINHIPLLKRIYPKARIIHIIRDARDQCLSIREFAGLSLVRAAQRWTANVSRARESAKRFPGDVIEVHYEKLLEAPEAELTRVCDFLGLQFTEDMLTVSRPTERHGQARGQNTVMRTNKGRYLEALSPDEIRRIEEIAAPMLKAYGYPVADGIRTRSPGKLEMELYRMRDGVQVLRLFMRERGVLAGLDFVRRFYRKSGWRTVSSD